MAQGAPGILKDKVGHLGDKIMGEPAVRPPKRGGKKPAHKPRDLDESRQL